MNAEKLPEAQSWGLPPQVRVLVRDWLSANHVLLVSPEGNVLIDTGYASRATRTLQLLRSAQALGEAPLALIANTHCHSDHMGGNAAVAAAFGCPIAIPEGEVPLIDAWDDKALLLGYADQRADRFSAQQTLRAGEIYRWGEHDWEAVAAPGHDMGALCFFNAAHGILISGDALWHNGFGFVMPPEIDPFALPATRATLEALARLPIRTVIPGHGAPFDDVEQALERAFRRVAAFESDPLRLARQALKVVLAFSLLDRGSLPLAGMSDYVSRIGIYRDFNERFFRLPPPELARLLIDDLERALAVRREGDRLVPMAAAAG